MQQQHGITDRLIGLVERLKSSPEPHKEGFELEELRKITLFIEREAHLLGKDTEVEIAALLSKLH